MTPHPGEHEEAVVSEATKRPWQAIEFDPKSAEFVGTDKGWSVFGPDLSEWVASCGWGGNSGDCAELIVRCVNSHAALVEALEAAGETLEFALAKLGGCGRGDDKDRRADAEFPGGVSTLEQIRAALALAKGGK
jgi:hypothetical protein